MEHLLAAAHKAAADPPLTWQDVVTVAICAVGAIGLVYIVAKYL